MPKLILVRHGQTDYNAQRRYQGQTDIALNAVGIEEATKLQSRLAIYSIRAAYSSDLQRAYDTANLALAGHPSKIEIQSEPLLREISGGKFEGLTWPQMSEQYPEAAALWTKDRVNHPPPDGESLQHGANRVKLWLDQTLQIYGSDEGANILVVTHGGIISVLLCSIMAMDLNRMWQWRIDNCSISIVDIYDKGGILSLFNSL